MGQDQQPTNLGWLLAELEAARRLTDGDRELLDAATTEALEPARQRRFQAVSEDLHVTLQRLEAERETSEEARELASATAAARASIFPSVTTGAPPLQPEADWSQLFRPGGGIVARPAGPSIPQFLLFTPPYNAGGPLTEQTVPFEDPVQAGADLVSKTAWARPQTGELSLGCGGGQPWIQGNRIGPPRPMTDTWSDGDALIIDASVGQIADVSSLTANATTLAGGAALTTSRWENAWWRFVYCWPGPESAPGKGLIAVRGDLIVAISASGVGRQAMSSTTFLDVRLHSADEDNTPVIDRQDWSSPAAANARLPVPAGTASAWVSAVAVIYAMRAGVNDPKGGFVGVDLRADEAKSIFKPDIPPLMNTPLMVPAIAVSAV